MSSAGWQYCTAPTAKCMNHAANNACGRSNNPVAVITHAAVIMRAAVIMHVACAVIRHAAVITHAAVTV